MKIWGNLCNFRESFRKVLGDRKFCRLNLKGLATPMPTTTGTDPNTLWGTWIEAAIFYAKNLDQVRTVLERLDSTEATAIERAKVAVRDTMLSGDLAFLLANLTFIPAALKKRRRKWLASWFTMYP